MTQNTTTCNYPTNCDQSCDKSCLYCKAKVSETSCYGKINDFGIVYYRCPNCHTVAVAKEECKKILQLAYQQSYYGIGDRKFWPIITSALRVIYRYRASRLAKALSNQGRVLDIGCGDGSFAEGLAEQKLNVDGVELPGKAFERAKKVESSKIRISEGPLRSGMFEKSCFDAVSMNHVLEHIPNPRSTLIEIAAILKQGGILVLSLPNIHSRQYSLFKFAWLHLDPPQHLFFMSKEDLERELRQLGLELCYETNFSFMYDPFGYVQSILNLIPHQPRDFLYNCLKGRLSKRDLVRFTWHFILGSCLALPSVILSCYDAFVSKRSATMELWFKKSPLSIQQTLIDTSE